MATLAEVNQTLLEVAQNTESTSQSIGDFIENIKGSRGDKLEAEREKSSLLQKVGGIGAAATGSVSTAARGFRLPSLPDMSGLKNILTGAGLTALTLGLMKGVAKRGVIGAVATAFANDIGNYIEGATGSAQLGDAAERATIGASFGLLLGKRFAVLGGIIGGLATKENTELVTDIGKNLKTNWEEASKKLEPILGFLPSFDGTVAALAGFTNKGLTGINGFLESGFSSEEFQQNLGATVGLLGTVAALLLPKGLFGKVLKGVARVALFTPLGRALTAIGVAGTTAYNLAGGGPGGYDPNSVADNAMLTGGALATGYLGVKTFQGFRSLDRRASSLFSGATGMADDAFGAANDNIARARPGTVVRSAAGNLVLAGIDGRPTTIKAPAGARVGDLVRGGKIVGRGLLGRAAGLAFGLPGLTASFALTPSTVSADNDFMSTEEGFSQSNNLSGFTQFNKMRERFEYLRSEGLNKAATILEGTAAQRYPQQYNDYITSQVSPSIDQNGLETMSVGLGPRANPSPTVIQDNSVTTTGGDTSNIMLNQLNAREREIGFGTNG